ncbi:MAG: OPT/YSL family transporter, partial [Melioribacteraceae bacterium]|nr:OPT/YSL family transporter [Melioribacteraceae bacterium]
AAVMELSGVRSLPFAVGAYLPLSTSSPIFIGGLVKMITDKVKKNGEEESDIGPGALFSSGLIAGGALTGILIAILVGTDYDGEPIADYLNTGFAGMMGGFGDIVSLILFLGLAVVLLAFAVSKNK